MYFLKDNNGFISRCKSISQKGGLYQEGRGKKSIFTTNN